MIDLVKELKAVLKEKHLSPEAAAQFIGTSGREVRRWLQDGATPNVLSRRAIHAGIRRIRRSM